MELKEVSVNKTGIIAGTIICIALIIYFLLMRSINLTGSALAWSVNFIIIFLGIYVTYRYYRSVTKPNIDYLPGMLLGTITTIVCASLFTFFIYIYFSVIEPSQLQLLKDNILFMGEGITPLRAAGATIIEGISSGVIISFAMMQYYKSGFRKSADDKSEQG